MACLKLILLTFTMMLSSFLFAQVDHDVKVRETLYSISKKYNISIQDLVRANPKAKRGLHEGMQISIPSVNGASDTTEYKLHKVRPLESFYSIQSKYGIKAKELLQLNPSLSEGFRAGKQIKIPIHKTEEIAEVKKIERVEGQFDFFEKLKNKRSKFKKKDSYNIAFLLPLYLDKNDTIEVYQNPEGNSEIYKKTHYALDFYSGAKIAIDSLHKAGMSINIHVYDTKNEPEETFDIVTKTAFNDMDLVIGPFYSKNFKIAADVLRRKRTPIVAPLSSKNSLLENTPHAFQVIPSQKRQITYLSEYISEHYGSECISIVRRNNEEEQNYANLMLSSLKLDTMFNYKEILVEEAVIDSIHHEIDSMAATNVFLIPSTDKAFVTDLLTKLNATRDRSLVLFGMPEWHDFEGLDYTYMTHLKVHLPNSGLLSYQDSLTMYFVENFEESTRNAPNERFAFAGFDITYYFLSQLKNQGGISTDMYLEPEQLLNMNFDFNDKRNKRDGSRNQSVQIIQYKEFEIAPIRE